MQGCTWVGQLGENDLKKRKTYKNNGFRVKSDTNLINSLTQQCSYFCFYFHREEGKYQKF